MFDSRPDSSFSARNLSRRGLLRSAAALAAAGAGAVVLAGCGLQPATAFVPDASPGSIKRIATYLGGKKGIPDKTKQYDAVRDADVKNGLTWLTPAPLNNTYAMAIRSEEATKLGITKLSQVAKLPVGDRTFCVESEFKSRPDGFDPMLAAYDLKLGAADGVPNGSVNVLDTGVVYEATNRGTCNFGEAFTTDGRINSLGLTVLEDDDEFFPAYNVAPVLLTATLEKYPQLKGIFEQISPKLTDVEQRKLNLRVDVGGEEPADVAFDWMTKQGFITAP